MTTASGKSHVDADCKDVRPLLVVSVSGLATASIGCYGSSWNQTPAIDSLAANGCVFDRWISTRDSNRDLPCCFDQVEPWIEPWKRAGTTIMVRESDRGDCVSTDQTLDGTHKFDTVIQVDSLGGGNPDASQDSRAAEVGSDWPHQTQPAEDIDDTRLAALMATVIEQDATTDGDWSLMWLHTDFLKKCWDAPRFLFPIDEIEFDAEPDPSGIDDEMDPNMDRLSLPAIMPGCEVPRINLSDIDDSTVDHPDLVNSWMRTYGCQVRLLDLMIQILTQSLIRDDVRIMVLGTSGFSLGQNGWIGHRAGPLRSVDCRLPMIIGNCGPIRMPQPTPSDQLSDILCDLGSVDTGNRSFDHEGGSMNWCAADRWVESPDPTQDFIQTQSDRSTSAITTPGWFYVEDHDQSEHLFLKPDDIEDYNDVARLRPDVVDTLSGHLTSR